MSNEDATREYGWAYHTGDVQFPRRPVADFFPQVRAQRGAIKYPPPPTIEQLAEQRRRDAKLINRARKRFQREKRRARYAIERLRDAWAVWKGDKQVVEDDDWWT